MEQKKTDSGEQDSKKLSNGGSAHLIRHPGKKWRIKSVEKKPRLNNVSGMLEICQSKRFC